MPKLQTMIALGLLGGGGIPVMSVTGTTAFGSITEGSPATQVLTITNTGTATLTIGARSYPTGFAESVAPGSLSIAPGANTTFTVQATAATVGSFSGNISIVNNTPSTPYLVAVSVTVTSSLLVGLTAYYLLGEASGNRADSSGNGYTLTDNNTVTQNTGIQGNAAEFLAANSETLSLADTADFRGLDRDWSFDFWFYPTTVTGTMVLFSKGAGTDTGTLDYACFRTGTDIFFRASNGSAFTTISRPGLTINTWHYIYGEHDSVANLLKLYLNNGTPDSQAFSASNSHLPGGLFRFGAHADGSLFYTGRIDESSHYLRKLTTTERATRYNAGAGNTYPFS